MVTADDGAMRMPSAPDQHNKEKNFVDVAVRLPDLNAPSIQLRLSTVEQKSAHEPVTQPPPSLSRLHIPFAVAAM